MFNTSGTKFMLLVYVSVAGGSQEQRPWATDPRLSRIATGGWNVPSLVGKEREQVCEVERYPLDAVGLTSTHGLDSGTSLLKSGWTHSLKLPLVRGG